MSAPRLGEDRIRLTASSGAFYCSGGPGATRPTTAPSTPRAPLRSPARPVSLKAHLQPPLPHTLPAPAHLAVRDLQLESGATRPTTAPSTPRAPLRSPAQPVSLKAHLHPPLPHTLPAPAHLASAAAGGGERWRSRRAGAACRRESRPALSRRQAATTLRRVAPGLPAAPSPRTPRRGPGARRGP
jgi:hypothetical protein